jgi:hypothetical protein
MNKDDPDLGRPQTRMENPTHATVDLPGNNQVEKIHRHEDQLRFHGPRSFLEGVYRQNGGQTGQNGNIGPYYYIISRFVGIVAAGRRGRKTNPTTESGMPPMTGTFDFEVDYLMEVELVIANNKISRPVYLNPNEQPVDIQTYPHLDNEGQVPMTGSYNYRFCTVSANCPLGYQYVGRTYMVVSQSTMPYLHRPPYNGQYVLHLVKFDKQTRKTIPTEGMSGLFLGSTIATEGIQLMPRAYSLNKEIYSKLIELMANQKSSGEDPSNAREVEAEIEKSGFKKEDLEEDEEEDDNNPDGSGRTTSTDTTATADLQIRKLVPQSDLRGFVTIPRKNCAGTSVGVRELRAKYYHRLNENLAWGYIGALLYQQSQCPGAERASFAFTLVKHATTLV